MSEYEQISACQWMIDYYKKLAEQSFELHYDLANAYFMYDHYMGYVAKYEKKLDDLLPF